MNLGPFVSNPALLGQHSSQGSLQLGYQVPPQVVYASKRLEHINCVLAATEDRGGLYIGDTICTVRLEHLADNNIGALVCCNQEAAQNISRIKMPIKYKYIEISDHVTYPIRLHFESAFEFIESNLNANRNVLVQCHGGVSRSATIICAYLMKKNHWTAEQAIGFLKQKRHRAKPNEGFRQQLKQYEVVLGVSSPQQNKEAQETHWNTSSMRNSLSPEDFSPVKSFMSAGKIYQGSKTMDLYSSPVKKTLDQEHQMETAGLNFNPEQKKRANLDSSPYSYKFEVGQQFVRPQPRVQMHPMYSSHSKYGQMNLNSSYNQPRPSLPPMYQPLAPWPRMQAPQHSQLNTSLPTWYPRGY